MTIRAAFVVAWTPLVFLLLSSPLRAQETEVVELWRTDGAVEGLSLAWVSDAVLDDNGKVWILDEYTSKISVWQWPALDRPPESPRVISDDLSAPVALAARPAGGVAVLDVVARAVVLFGADGSPEGTVDLAGIQFLFPKDLLVLPSGEIVILGGSMKSDAGLWAFSPTGTLLAESFPSISVGDRRITAMIAGGVGAVNDWGILVSRAQAPGLYAVDTTRWNVALLDPLEPLFPNQGEDFLIRSDEGRSTSFGFHWFFTRPVALIPLPSGNLLHVVADQEGDRGVWEIRSGDGILLRRFEVQAGYRPLAYAKNGMLLAMRLDPLTRDQSLVGVRLSWDVIR